MTPEPWKEPGMAVGTGYGLAVDGAGVGNLPGAYVCPGPETLAKYI